MLSGCFTTLSSLIGLKISRHILNQSEVKPNPIVTRSHTFSRALCRLQVFASCFDWFTGLSVSFVIGQSDNFGLGFTILDFYLALGKQSKTQRKDVTKEIETINAVETVMVVSLIKKVSQVNETLDVLALFVQDVT